MDEYNLNILNLYDNWVTRKINAIQDIAMYNKAIEQKDWGMFGNYGKKDLYNTVAGHQAKLKEIQGILDMYQSAVSSILAG